MKKKIIMPYSLIPRLIFTGAFFALLVILYNVYEFSDFLDMFEKVFPSRFDNELYDLKYSPFIVCTLFF